MAFGATLQAYSVQAPPVLRIFLSGEFRAAFRAVEKRVPGAAAVMRGKRQGRKTDYQNLMLDTPVVAIDFETADYSPDSACAVGLAKIWQGRVTDTFYSLIRPPRRHIVFSWLHGITWNKVRNSPSFAELWPQLASFFEGATHFVAHNAPFDRRVLDACCRAAQIEYSMLPFICTLKESRYRLDLPSYRLNSLCTHCGIALTHHHAGSDALAAAELLIYLQHLDGIEFQNS